MYKIVIMHIQNKKKKCQQPGQTYTPHNQATLSTYKTNHHGIGSKLLY